jgi:hypothetical protein
MKFLAILLLFGASLWGQTDGTLQLFTGSPAAPSQISVSVTGPPGSRTLCFWVVARYPVGNASAVQPQCIVNAPDVFTSANYATISWTPLQGATGYDVVRLPGQTLQSCTTCLVASNTTSTSVRDNGSGLTSYTVTNVGGTQCTFYINNRDYPLPRIIEQCTLPFQFGQCIIFPDLTQQCTAAGGGGTGVTLINTTTPVTGGPITTIGTIACPTCVVNVTASSPVVSSGGTTPNISCPTCGTGTGTVTNIGTTSPITGGPITTTGTIACATCLTGTPANHLVTLGVGTQAINTVATTGTSGQVLTSNGVAADPTFQAGATGTVTNIATTSPITGGPISSTGTIACATCVTNVTASGPITSSGGTTPNIACATCTTGGVTTVTGTAPIVSSGGTTPAISCPTCLVGTPSNHGTVISSATQTVSITSPGTAGFVLTSNGASADPTYQAAGGGGLTCNKYTVTQSPFGTTWTVTGQSGQAVTSTSTQTINIVTLASKTVINTLRIKVNTVYAGTSMTNYQMSLGTNASGGSTISFEPNFTVGGTANTFSLDSPFGSCTASCPGYLDDGGSFSGADNGETVTATFTQTGGTNLTATTAGTLDITLCTTTLP